MNMKRSDKNKKAISPVVATILLISIVIVIGLIVFLWFRGITEEAITKFDGQNVKLVCEDVSFDASYSAGLVYISNTGNVPIFRMKAKIEGEGSFATEFVGDDGTWPEEGLNQLGRYSGIIRTEGEKITLVPVLRGRTSEGEKTHTCDERHGFEIIV